MKSCRSCRYRLVEPNGSLSCLQLYGTYGIEKMKKEGLVGTCKDWKPTERMAGDMTPTAEQLDNLKALASWIHNHVIDGQDYHTTLSMIEKKVRKMRRDDQEKARESERKMSMTMQELREKIAAAKPGEVIEIPKSFDFAESITIPANVSIISREGLRTAAESDLVAFTTEKARER